MSTFKLTPQDEANIWAIAAARLAQKEGPSDRMRSRDAGEARGEQLANEFCIAASDYLEALQYIDAGHSPHTSLGLVEVTITTGKDPASHTMTVKLV